MEVFSLKEVYVFLLLSLASSNCQTTYIISILKRIRKEEKKKEKNYFFTLLLLQKPLTLKLYTPYPNRLYTRSRKQILFKVKDVKLFSISIHIFSI